MLFEYDEEKNSRNIQKHGISFKSAARVFFDYDRIEFYDEENSITEDRYDTIGNLSAGIGETVIGNVGKFGGDTQDILFVVYTERIRKRDGNSAEEVTRLISARFATSFERGLYYGKI
ncbi:MAG: BrnT family toxin [Lachnospiraceae bacterium]|nr:BrnT family toxin [Lachnospiraceae bacterium]